MGVRFQDYYSILGVGRGASQDEIQRAYRKLARKYHPDVSKACGAEGKFKEITEAYEVLKDPEKRRRYDTLGAQWKAGQEFTPPPGWDVHFDFGGSRGGRGAFEGKGFESAFGGSGFSDFFDALFGGLGRGRSRSRGGATGGRAARGRSVESEIRIVLEDAVRGATRSIRLDTIDPATGARSSRSYDVKIPPGVKEGSVIRLPGQGEPGAGSAPAGDLLLRVRFAPHPRFRPAGHDLEATVEISPWEAALGAKVPLATLGGSVTLTIPPGTQGGQKLRLRGRGLPRGKGKRGDLIVVVRIVVPKELGREERELFEKLSKVSRFKPRR